MAKLVWFGLISVASSQVPRASARESEHERAKRCFIWCSFHKMTYNSIDFTIMLCLILLGASIVLRK